MVLWSFFDQRITNFNYFRIRKLLVSIISESKNHQFRLFLKYQGISYFHERTNKVLMVIKTIFWNREYIKTDLLIRLYAKMILDWLSDRFLIEIGNFEHFDASVVMFEGCDIRWKIKVLLVQINYKGFKLFLGFG